MKNILKSLFFNNKLSQREGKTMKNFFLLVLMGITLASGHVLTINADDRTVPLVLNRNWSIYHEPAAPSTVKLAAAELQRVIEVSTGLRLAVTNNEPSGQAICIGAKGIMKKAGFSDDGLAPDAFRIVSKGNNIYIFGKDTPDDYKGALMSRGTLFGTYEFLEKFIGVTWLMPGELGEEIPKLQDLRIPQMDISQTPSFLSHSLVDIQGQIRPAIPEDVDPLFGGNGPMLVDRWMLRNKLFNPSVGFLKVRELISYGHVWKAIITPKDMEAHPQWQATGGAKNSFCTSNPEAVEFYAQRLIERFDKDPTRLSASLSAEDGPVICNCPKCLALTEKNWYGEESATPLVLTFYNDVAKIVGRKYPDKMLGGFVYYNFMYPPSKPFKMEKNVYLFLAPVNYYGWGNAKPKLRADFARLISGWTAITENFNYSSWSLWLRDFVGAPLPPPLPLMKFEFQTLHENNVKRVWFMGIGAWGYGACHNYLMAKLMWNADADVDALYREWMRKAYGPAWEPMDKFHMLLLKRILDRKNAESPRYTGDNYEVNYDFVDKVYKPVFPELERYYVEALSKAETEKQRKRIGILGDNMKMLHYNMRRAGMLADPEKSVFYLSNEAYPKFLTDSRYFLSLYRDHGLRDTPLLYNGQFDSRAENPPMELRKLDIPRIPAGVLAPNVDGDLSDKAWQSAAVADKFRSIGNRMPAGRQTTARLLYDDSNLYVSVTADAIQLNAEAGKKSDVSVDDVIELLLAIFPDAKQKFWRLSLNSENTQWNGTEKTPDPNIKFNSAVKMGNNGWTAEIAIPFKSIGVSSPPAGCEWSANIARIPPLISKDNANKNANAEKQSTWNASYRSCQEPNSFGVWIFSK